MRIQIADGNMYINAACIYIYNSKLYLTTRHQQRFRLPNIRRFFIRIMDYSVLMFTAISIGTNASIETKKKKEKEDFFSILNERAPHNGMSTEKMVRNAFDQHSHISFVDANGSCFSYCNIMKLTSTNKSLDTFRNA